MVAGEEGLHKIILVEKACPGNDATSRPKQEHTASKALMPVASGEPQDAGLVSLYVLLPNSLLHNLTCKMLNALTKHLH